MNIDFSLLLLILSAITGVIWLLDIVLFAKPRMSKVNSFLAEKGMNTEQFSEYLNSLDENGKPRELSTSAKEEKTGQKSSVADQKVLEQATLLYRESVPVEYAKSFFPILFAVLILRSFLFEPFQIPTGSMIPTLNVGDFIVVNKYAYGLRLPVTGTKIFEVDQPKRGDVMVFIPPHEPDYFIKRVIGLPGDHIRYADKVVYINGEPLIQEEIELIREQGVLHSREAIGGVTHDIYTAASQRFNRTYDWLRPEGMTIPEGQYFMMGDNRDNSSDSRYWGPASEAKIVGKAVAVWMHKEPGLHLPVFSQNRFIENAE
jgi:signal peptidase I